MDHPNWFCIRCNNRTFETGNFAATGTGFSKIFDYKYKNFTTLTCSKCQYTEIYRTSSNNIYTVLDLING